LILASLLLTWRKIGSKNLLMSSWPQAQRGGRIWAFPIWVHRSFSP